MTATIAPGPRLPMIAQTALTSPWLGERFIRRCTRHHGRTFRLNLYWLGELIVTSDLELVRELFITRKDAEPLATWIPGGSSFPRLLGDNPLVRTDGEEHKRYRRRLADPLRIYVREDLSELDREVRAAFEAAPAGEALSLWGTLEPLLFESLLRDALGIADAGRRARLRAAFTTFYKLGHRPWFFDPKLYAMLEGTRLRDRFDAADASIHEVIAEELSAGAGDGFRSGLLELAREWARECGVDEGWMCGEFVKSLVYAGYKTTTSACVWALLLLLHHPHLLERARAELEDGDDTLVAGSVREGLRLFPPHPLSPVRKLTETFSWGSLALPAGSVLGVAAPLVHRDPSVYREPNRFLPDRYRDGWAPPPHAWLPFGSGMRRCLGQQVALKKATQVVRTVVAHARLVPAQPRLEPVGLFDQVHGPRWGGRVFNLGT